MNHSFLGSLAAALVLTGATATAAVHPLNLGFASLELANGKVLKDGTIRTYDDTRDSVTIFTAKGAFSVPVLQLPENWAKQVRAKIALLPKVDKPVVTASPPPVPKDPPRNPAAANPAPATPPASPADPAAPAKSAKPPAPLTPEEAHQKLLELIRSTAEEMAIGRFGEGRFELYSIEEVPGWSHQYRIRGKALKYRRAGSSVTIDRDFDYTFEAKPDEPLRLLEEQID